MRSTPASEIVASPHSTTPLLSARSRRSEIAACRSCPMRTLIVRRPKRQIGEAAGCPWPVKLVVETRRTGEIPQRVNDREKTVLPVSRDQIGAVPNHFVRPAMNCRRLDVQRCGRARRGGQEPTAVDDAADDCLADVLPDAMLHLPTQKEGPSRGRRFDLRLSAGIRVARQARLETIMTPEDLDPPFARPIDALERLPQRLAMLYKCGRHAVVVGKHRSVAAPCGS